MLDPWLKKRGLTEVTQARLRPPPPLCSSSSSRPCRPQHHLSQAPAPAPTPLQHLPRLLRPPGAPQVLIYFAVAKLGEMPTDGKTDLNPEGLTAACGPHAEAFAARLHRAGLACKVLPPKEFQVSMIEKLIWISAFMLVGARHPGATVGQARSEAHAPRAAPLSRASTLPAFLAEAGR